MKNILVVMLLVLVCSSVAYADFSLSFGPVQIGEERIPINLSDFKVVSEVQNIKTEAYWEKDSVQWIRTKNNLLAPRARLTVKVFQASSDLHVRYQDQSIIPAKRKGYFQTELYISLFNPGMIRIFKGNRQIGRVYINAEYSDKKFQTQLIDYSCARYNVRISGIDNEYLSVGCRMERIGDWGEEKPRLEISWASTNLRLLDDSDPPYVAILRSSDPVNFIVKNQQGEKRTVTIQASVPKRMHRLKTALGFGPYMYRSKQDGKAVDQEQLSPAGMLYANLFLTGQTSIRAFDAIVGKKSFFNNFGFYFAYEVAAAFDNRISVVPLLGMQGLTFHQTGAGTYTTAIFPQGVEVVFRNAFGLENYLLVYGMFLSPTSKHKYNNVWVRFGKRIFWELNYIKWETSNRFASMWGLSIGVPFVALF